MIEPDHPDLSVRRQCELLGLNRSTCYFTPAGESAENLELMRLIDEQYTKTPFFGSRKIIIWLRDKKKRSVNRKRIQRLMRLMGLQAIYPKPTTKRATGHKIYPYLLRNVKIRQSNHVWSTDVTYVPMREGFMYLTAVIDWHSRYVLSWRLSNTLDVGFCLEALEEALEQGRPEIFNTDQGVQFTCSAFTSRVEKAGVAISMDGKGRALDNVFVERLWRSVKYEEIYLHDYASVPELASGLADYFRFYDWDRPHQSLRYRTPGEVYFERAS
jgi:putative transposase